MVAADAPPLGPPASATLDRSRSAEVLHVHETWPRRLDRAPIVVDSTAQAEGLACAVRSTEDLGLLTVLGIVFGAAPLPLLEMYTRGITLHTSRADSRRHLPAVLELAATGVFDRPRRSTTPQMPGWLPTKLVLTRPSP